MTLTLYLKSKRRRPVRFGLALPFGDHQADPPRAWCTHCGAEVFERGADRCIHCRNMRGANDRAIL